MHLEKNVKIVKTLNNLFGKMQLKKKDIVKKL